jgi:hypothetical protein
MTCPECGAKLTGVEEKQDDAVQEQDARYPEDGAELGFVVHLLGKSDTAKAFILYEYRNGEDNYLNGYELQALGKDAEVTISSDEDLETALHSGDLWVVDWETGTPSTEQNELGDERPGVVYVVPKTSEIPTSMLSDPVQADGEYLATVDQGTVEWGAQLPEYKEFFLHGDRFNGRYIFRSIGRQASRTYGWSMEDFEEGVQGEVRKDTNWVMEKPTSQTPYVLSKEAVNGNWLPPQGISALPKSVRESLSDDEQFWTMEHREALEVREALFDSESADSDEDEDDQNEKALVAVEEAWRRLKESVVSWKNEPADSLFITKQQEDGRWRWVTISSTAFLDKEQEIVSTEGIAKSVERSEDGQSYGPMLYWHEPSIVLGECDFQAQDGLCLIESGLWHNNEVGEAARKAVGGNIGGWGVSIGFLPLLGSDNEIVNGRVATVVWKDIQIVERSVLPSTQAATWYSSIVNKSTEDIMDTRKRDALVELLGEDVASRVLEDSKEVNAKAQDPDAVFKEVGLDVNSGMLKNVLDGVLRVFGVGKERGLEAEAYSVRRAFSDSHGHTGYYDEPYGYRYVREVFPDYVIVEEYDTLMKYPYTKVGDEYEFEDPTEVEVEYVEKATNDEEDLDMSKKDQERPEDQVLKQEEEDEEEEEEEEEEEMEEKDLDS